MPLSIKRPLPPMEARPVDEIPAACNGNTSRNGTDFVAWPFATKRKSISNRNRGSRSRGIFPILSRRWGVAGQAIRARRRDRDSRRRPLVVRRAVDAGSSGREPRSQTGRRTSGFVRSLRSVARRARQIAARGAPGRAPRQARTFRRQVPCEENPRSASPRQHRKSPWRGDGFAEWAPASMESSPSGSICRT